MRDTESVRQELCETLLYGNPPPSTFPGLIHKTWAATGYEPKWWYGSCANETLSEIYSTTLCDRTSFMLWRIVRLLIIPCGELEPPLYGWPPCTDEYAGCASAAMSRGRPTGKGGLEGTRLLAGLDFGMANSGSLRSCLFPLFGGFRRCGWTSVSTCDCSGLEGSIGFASQLPRPFLASFEGSGGGYVGARLWAPP